MANDKPKSPFAAKFDSPEVEAVRLKELRETVTATAIDQLPPVSWFAAKLPERTTTGLVEWYRKLGWNPEE
jgi:hypothetical protein